MLLAAAVVAVVMALFSLYPRFDYYMVTGRWYPRVHVDTLVSPKKVASWKKGDLIMADGSAVPVPGFSELPAKSDALNAITKEGIEVDSKGRVFGLLGIMHTCGNEGWGTEIRRVDIGNLLFYLRQGKTSRRHLLTEAEPPQYGVEFNNGRWISTGFRYYQRFLSTYPTP